jgi:23S rRNA pseudouridine955/2504/2580 synthase
MKAELRITPLNHRKRLDRFLSKELSLPYSAIMRLIRRGDVKVNSKRIKDNSFILNIEDFVEVYYKSPTESKSSIKPVNLKLKVLYEDKDYILLSKPSGLPVQGGTNVNVSLINHLSYILDTPFLVHRLDKDTSGVIVVAKHLRASQEFMTVMVNKNITKIYLALLKGKVKQFFRVSIPVSGKNAITMFTLKKYFKGSSLVEAKILTGRKHQIRIHTSKIGNPIAGDKKYGDFSWNRELKKIGLKRIFLHAFYIKFLNPISNKVIEIIDPLPDDLKIFLEKL